MRLLTPGLRSWRQEKGRGEGAPRSRPEALDVRTRGEVGGDTGRPMGQAAPGPEASAMEFCAQWGMNGVEGERPGGASARGPYRLFQPTHGDTWGMRRNAKPCIVSAAA